MSDPIKFGAGKTYLAVHSGTTVPFDGEISIETMMTETDYLVSYDDGGEFSVETTQEDLKPAHEAVAEDVVTMESGGNLKLTMDAGNIDNFALAVGASAAAAKTLSGRVGKGIAVGPRQPQKLTLLHKSPHLDDPSKEDFLYLPRVVAEMNVTYTHVKGVRKAEVTFKTLRSHQDGTNSSLDMRMTSEMGGHSYEWSED